MTQILITVQSFAAIGRRSSGDPVAD